MGVSVFLLQRFMLKSITNPEMSSPFVSLLKIFLFLSLTPWTNCSRSVSKSFLHASCCWLSCLICNSVHSRVHLFICLWAQEVQYFSFFLSLIIFFHLFFSPLLQNKEYLLMTRVWSQDGPYFVFVVYLMQWIVMAIRFEGMQSRAKGKQQLVYAIISYGVDIVGTFKRNCYQSSRISSRDSVMNYE